MERRLAAILAADVVGYSRLMEADEEATLAMLSVCRQVIDGLIANHRGRVFGSAGDSVIAEFASPVEAVRCAVAIQTEIEGRGADVPENRRMRLRIGVNLGDVMAEGDNLFGDGVNIAARLEEIAGPGDVCISAKVHDEVAGKTDGVFIDAGEHQVKNITAPIRVWRWSEVGDAGEVHRSAEALVLPGKPSVAVLPFTNMSGDTEQEYFSDGITEDIITELSRFRSLFVIARHSSFAFKDQAVNVGEVGEKLGVAYVVEGSVRKAGNRVRITAQLVEATTGNHIWAERYDRDLEDVFAVQDDVVRAIVGTLAVRLEHEEIDTARRKMPEHMRAYDWWLRGKKCLDLATLEATEEAHSLFCKSVEVEPDYARGFAGLAEATYSRAFFPPLPKPFEEMVEDALVHAERAVLLDDTDSRPHVILGWACMFRRDFDRARRHFDLSGSLNPNDADAIMQRACALALLGDANTGVDQAQSAIRLNPHHPGWYLEYVCMVNFVARRYETVLATAAMGRDTFPSSPAYRAAASAYLGRAEDARHHGEALVASLQPLWDWPSGAGLLDYAEYLCQVIPFRNTEDADHLLEGLRRANQAE